MAPTTKVPKGRLKPYPLVALGMCPQPSLRDGFRWAVGPSVETLGYSHRSLRDQERWEIGEAFGFACVYEVPKYRISKTLRETLAANNTVLRPQMLILQVGAADAGPSEF